MTERMRSFLMGLMMGLLGHGIRETAVERSFRFDPESGLLIIYNDDGSLGYTFSEGDFSLTVTEV